MAYSPLLSDDDEKHYIKRKYRDGRYSLRFVFAAFIMLYAAFGYLDRWVAGDFLKAFLFIRFALVIPFLLLVILLSYHKSFYLWCQPVIMASYVIGGAGISYMLIMLPDNFSYYGGSFMVLYGGYFLLKLNTRYAIIGGILNLALFIGGYAIIYGRVSFDVWLIFSFLLGSNVIGAIGNYLLEVRGRSLYAQEQEILEKNRQLENQISDQQKELVQIEKAIQSASDAIAIYNTEGKLTYTNQAYENLIESSEAFAIREHDKKDYHVHRSVKDSWEDEQIIIKTDGKNLVMLLQGDIVKEADGKIIGYVESYKNITERKENEREIEHLSYHDSLTGIYNRRFFDEALKRMNTPWNLPLTLMIVDVNGLKLTNDAFGHEVGDQLLVKVATVLEHECRSDDIVARIGGDEFALLMPKTNEEQAHKILKRLKEVFKTGKTEALPITISVSCGFNTKTKEHESMSSVFKKAEDAMYRKKISEKKSLRYQMIDLIMETLYAKSPREQAHSKRVSLLCEQLARAMGIEDASELTTAGMLHDIGKVAISEHILEKQKPLTDAEWVEIKKHPEVGFSILSSVSEYGVLAEWILAHHEHWDGSGYPIGLQGSAIPKASRVIAITDAYDAMISDRPYRKGISHTEAIREIEKCAGRQFDPDIVKVFTKMMAKKMPRGL